MDEQQAIDFLGINSVSQGKRFKSEQDVNAFLDIENIPESPSEPRDEAISRKHDYTFTVPGMGGMGEIGQLAEPMVGIADAAKTLAVAPVVWPVAKSIGLLTPMYGRTGRLTSGPYTGAGQEIEEKILEKATPEPKTKLGREIVDATGKGIEWYLTPSRKAGEFMREHVSPEAGYLTESAGEIAQFGLLPKILRKGKERFTLGKEGTVLERMTKPQKIESQFKSEAFTERFLRGDVELSRSGGQVLEDVRVKQTKGQIKIDKSMTLYSGINPKILSDFWTKNIGGPIWDKGIQKGIPKLLEKVPGGKIINRALIYDYRGNLKNTETYIKSFEDMKQGQAIGREYAIDLGQRLQSVPEKVQLKIGEYITTKEPTVELTGNALELAKEAKNVMLDLGKQAVETGLLSEETFFKNAGKYMPRLYTSKEYQSLLTKFNVAKPNRLDLSRFKQRKDIPKKIREQMGEILTPGYPVAKGITQLTHDIETARFFNGIARVQDWAIPENVKDVAIPEGFKQLPSNEKLGKLSKAYVHPEIFKDLQEVVRVMETPEKVWRKTLGAWKFGKVILSPKTHARNMMSNSILAHLGGLPMPVQPIYLTKAVKAMRTKNAYWKQAKGFGLLRETFTNAELRELFNRVESEMKGIKAGALPEKLGKIGLAWEGTKTGLNKAAKLYEAEEQWFKMAKYIHNVERLKMTPESAFKDAEKWLFNYGKVTKFQEKYRTKWYGAPFATFTFKAIPRVTEAMIKTPWRFALPVSIIYALEKAAANKFDDTKKQIKAKKAILPDWMKGNFMGIPNFARVPFADEYGREYYLNLTYIMPWGDLGEGGNFGPIPGSLMPFSQPFVKEPFQQFANFDTFWKENIVKEEDVAGLKGSEGKKPGEILSPLTPAGRKALSIRGKHLGQALVPTPVIDVSKAIAAYKARPDYKGRLRPKEAIVLDVFFGVKLYGVDYADRIIQDISKKNPKKSDVAIKLKSQIKTLSRQKNTTVQHGKSGEYYDKEIKKRIDQLVGLATEIQGTSELSKQIKGESK